MTDTKSLFMQSRRRRFEGFPAGTIRFDWLFTLFCTWVVFGLYIDGWAHAHDKVDDTFFTPWHALLYVGVASLGLFLLIHQWRNVSKGYSFFHALPNGYFMSLIGVGLFLGGGMFDIFWHEAFGFEVDLETLLSPAHLILAISGVLMVTGPIRSAWTCYSAGDHLGWVDIGPTLINATLVLAVLTFFTQFVSPFSNTYRVEHSSGVNRAIYSDLYLINADGSKQTRLTNASGISYWGGIWSPDGAHILATKFAPDDLQSGSTLVLLNADGTGEMPITTLPGGNYLPTWVQFNDGGRVAFLNDHQGRRDVYWIEVAPDSTFGDAHRLTTTDANEWQPTWSPDGTQLMFIADERILIINMNGMSNLQGSTRDLGSGIAAAWSPDGKQIVYQAVNGDTHDLYVMNANGTNVQHIVTHPAYDTEPSWSRDGKQILFKSWRGEFSGIYALDSACLNAPQTCESTVVNLIHNAVLDSDYANTAPDGRILYTSSGFNDNASSYESQSIVIAGVLLHSIMLMLIALQLIRRWHLPFGAMTLLIALPVALMTVFNDNTFVVLIGIVGGLFADVLLFALHPIPTDRNTWYGFAATVPAAFFAVYFLGIQLLGTGIPWRIHFWLGAIAFAGIAGIFVAMAYLSPFGRDAKTVS